MRTEQRLENFMVSRLRYYGCLCIYWLFESFENLILQNRDFRFLILIILQNMDNASLRELGDDSFMTEEKRLEDVTISNLHSSMGNLNNLREGMVLFKLVFFSISYLAKLSNVDICIPISQLLRMKKLLLLMQNSPRWDLGW